MADGALFATTSLIEITVPQPLSVGCLAIDGAFLDHELVTAEGPVKYGSIMSNASEMKKAFLAVDAIELDVTTVGIGKMLAFTVIDLHE